MTSENFGKRSVEEIFEIKFEEYKLNGNTLQNVTVRHNNHNCYPVVIHDVSDALKLFNAIANHHEEYHEKKEKETK